LIKIKQRKYNTVYDTQYVVYNYCDQEVLERLFNLRKIIIANVRLDGVISASIQPDISTKIRAINTFGE
jgi:hypothetical protein